MGKRPKEHIWRDNFKSFISYYRGHLKLFIFDMSSGVANAVFTSLSPLMVYRVLEALPEKDFSAVASGLAILLVLAILIAGTQYIGLRWGHILGARVETDMRDDFFRYLQKLSFSYFDRTRTGHIMSRMTNDLSLISETAHHAPEDLLLALLTFIGSFVIMFVINPVLALITLIPLPLIIFWGGFFQRRIYRGFREVRQNVAEINSQVENAIQGIREVKSYNNEQEQVARFENVNNSFLDAKERMCGLWANFQSGITFLVQSYALIFIVAGILLVYWDMATLSQLVTFMMYSSIITMPIIRMVHFAEQTQQTAAAFERFREVMREKPEIVDMPGALAPAGLNGDLEFVNVSFKYPGMKPEEPEVLKNISFRLPAGVTAALVGESGAGKSTLAALIPRFYEPDAGVIKLDEYDIKFLQQRFLRSQIGIVQQTPFLFDSTIRENILLGKPDATEEEVIAAARAANIWDFIDALPEKLDAATGEHGVRLSGGQRQRISIARVFLKNPAILIFDEATSALDNESEALVQNAMERLCRNRTTIIIAHRLSTVKNADLIFCLKHGEIVESGVHRELLERKGYYHSLYTMHTF